MKIGVVTLFPEAFDYLFDSKKSGLIGETLKKNTDIFIEDLRAHGSGKHKVVDSPPYGGGDGMLFKPEPLEEAFLSLSKRMQVPLENVNKIYLDPKGVSWSQKRAERLINSEADASSLILLCGRYGGVDQRFLDAYIDESVSVGRFILNGGELPALCLIESLIRLIPNTLGNAKSTEQDSFSSGLSGGVEPESYTRPQVWKGQKIPDILLSGHHKEIESYRSKRSQELTKEWFNREINDLEEHYKAFKDSKAIVFELTGENEDEG